MDLLVDPRNQDYHAAAGAAILAARIPIDVTFPYTSFSSIQARDRRDKAIHQV